MTDRELPGFVTVLKSMTDEDRKAAILATHHEYSERVQGWEILEDAYEAAGGFEDGGYLWPHAREDAAGIASRREQSRYHNHLETVTDTYLRHIFGSGIARTAENAAYLSWAANVDGHGSSLTDVLKRAIASGLVTGHCGVLVDKTNEAPAGESIADDRGRVLLRVFPATAIEDWRHKDGRLTGIKLVESGQGGGILDGETSQSESAVTRLVWATDGWARFDHEGQIVNGAALALGAVPVVIVRTKPAYRSEMVGRPMVPPRTIQSLFNRMSEQDDVLRNQAFSVLTLSVPESGNVQQAREELAHSTLSTAKALVAKGTLDFKTPSMDTARALGEAISSVTREIYRAAHVRAPKESAQSETAEAIKLQNEELNEALQDCVRVLRAAEQAIARLWCLWTAPTEQAAERLYAALKLQTVYPEEFFLGPASEEIAEIDDGLSLNLGPTMAKRLKVRAAKRLDPSLDAQALATVEAEIEKTIADDESMRLDMAKAARKAADTPDDDGI